MLEAVGELDLSLVYADYRVDGHGRPAYEPSMMVGDILDARPMRRLTIILVALFALALVPAARADSINACPRMRLYVVTGHRVERQFRVYAGRLVGEGASCRLARSVVRAFNRLPLTTKRRVSVPVSGRRWDCRWSPDFGTGDFKSQCDRAAARIGWRQAAILD